MHYFENYNFYRQLIILHNRENPTEEIPFLFKSFVLISGYRNYHNFTQSFSLAQATPDQLRQEIDKKESIKSINENEQSEPKIFNLIRLYVAEKHYDLSGKKNDEIEAEEKANDLLLLRAINEKLELINLKCKIRLVNRLTWEYNFEFYDLKRKKPLASINSLSAGQKAIIHLIFEAYGKESLKGGVIIDEPEIHLHHQLQYEYLQIVKKINKEQRCQYILATHSEFFIAPETIKNIIRFTLDNNNHTFVKSPVLTIDQKIYMRILSNSNSTRAFFGKKIVLVEGQTDHYFFKEIIEKLNPELIQEITVLDITGKKEYKNWKIFFETFGLAVYYIGDFDNVDEFNLSTHKKFKVKEQIEHPLKQGRLDNLTEEQKKELGAAYNELVKDENFIKMPQRRPWKKLLDIFRRFVSVEVKPHEIISKMKEMDPEIEKKIDEKYLDRIYILKFGALEDYTETAHGKLEEIISFCENSLSDWLDDNTNEKVKEIKKIIQ